ncbi:MAG: hypothetical protein OJF62_001456 [Pseudolabrys sp.]|jgi:hypothetical protein|nr:hypothetical protein [Pseudolabrys sp.]
MAEPNEQPKDIAADKIEAVLQPESLPQVEAPPLSPAGFVDESAVDVEAQQPGDTEEKAEVAASTWRDRLSARMPSVPLPHLAMPAIVMPTVSRRMRHRIALAAIVVAAAVFGAAVGGVAMRPAVAPAPRAETAVLDQTHALQQTVARLSKELVAVKGHLETAARDNRMQLAKLNEKLAQRADDITGSIAKPATVPAVMADKPQVAPVAPIPQPRPAIVQGWTVLEARNGYALLGNRGELFEVRPGVPLPGVGRVEEIRRDGDQWVVATAKGLIVQQAERSAAIRPRYYPPYSRPY